MLSTVKSPSVYPIAHSALPQFASAPNIAALKRSDDITDLLIFCAVYSSDAPVTLHSISFVAPSPSLAIFFERYTVTFESASQNISKASPSLSIGLFLAIAFAIIITVSLVEVSPSTHI